jgi:hypothetical protein
MHYCKLALVTMMLVGIVRAWADPPAAQSPQYRVGDTWSFLVQVTGRPDRTVVRTVVEATPGGDTVLLLDNGEGVKRWLVRDHASKRLDGKVFAYDESASDKRGQLLRDLDTAPGMTFPLRVGMKWPYVDDITTRDNHHVHRTGTFEVRSYERVKVAAGEFDVYKILMQGWWIDRSNVDLPAGASGKVTIEQWYSPFAKQIIFNQFKSHPYLQGRADYISTFEATEVHTSE